MEHHYCHCSQSASTSTSEVPSIERHRTESSASDLPTYATQNFPRLRNYPQNCRIWRRGRYWTTCYPFLLIFLLLHGRFHVPTTNWPSNAAINQDNTGESVHHNNEANNQRNDEEKKNDMFIVAKVPSNDYVKTNKVYMNARDLDAEVTRYVKVIVASPSNPFRFPPLANPAGAGPAGHFAGPSKHFCFSLANHADISLGQVGFSDLQRTWAGLSFHGQIQVEPLSFAPSQPTITSISLLVELLSGKKKNIAPSLVPVEPLDSDAMARQLRPQLSGMVLTTGQPLVFEYIQNEKSYLLKLTVNSMEGTADLLLSSPPEKVSFGPVSPNVVIVFDRPENSKLILSGRSKGKSFQSRALINPNWDFQQLGIGGLDKEFLSIFRRAFASRVFPPEFIEQLAMKHVRGILLYGPPGTGKTLIARQIGKMLNAREPKIVNGPEILDNFYFCHFGYVGESEANMRRLFADAEAEWRQSGPNSGLHIIIFDEIDAICKQRGSMAGSSSVHDTVVNQLLTKMDGVDQLNNILVIGMTNQKNLIDEALLRPGRFEVQLEIALPDEHGRLQILKIHTARMRECNKLDPEVDLEAIARRTENFSGAELEGLVRAAQSSAMNRLIKPGGKAQLDEDAVDKLRVTADDFEYALENDVKPSFGHNDEGLERLLYGGLCNWGDPVSRVLEEGRLLVKETAAQDTRGFVRALLTGPPNSGKSYLAAYIAKQSEFPFIKVCTPEEMVGYSEAAKCAQLKKIFEDAYKSPLSCIIIDNIERLLEYSPIGPRYSNMVLQTLLVLLGKRPPKDRRLLVLATTSNEHFLRDAELINVFSKVIRVEPLRMAEQIATVLEDKGIMSERDIRYIENILTMDPDYNVTIGIKRLLELLDFMQQSEPAQRIPLMLEAFRELEIM